MAPFKGCNSPVWPVRKANGITWQLTIDYRALNQVTRMLAPVVHRYLEVMAQIAHGDKYFTLLDLSHAFFALTLHESCWHKFAISVQAAQFTFTRLPQGFTTHRRHAINM